MQDYSDLDDVEGIILMLKQSSAPAHYSHDSVAIFSAVMIGIQALLLIIVIMAANGWNPSGSAISVAVFVFLISLFVAPRMS